MTGFVEHQMVEAGQQDVVVGGRAQQIGASQAFGDVEGAGAEVHQERVRPLGQHVLLQRQRRCAKRLAGADDVGDPLRRLVQPQA